MPEKATTPRLIEAATDRRVHTKTGLADLIRSISIPDLVDKYREMIVAAPRRGRDGHSYFVGRTGMPSSGVIRNRHEEYLCMALANDQAMIDLSSHRLEVLMYQFPLFTAGRSSKTKGADLIAHDSEARRLWILEVKVPGNQTPLRALYESLIYAAVVEANHRDIAMELRRSHPNRGSDHVRPSVAVVAPTAYWTAWTPNQATGNWWLPYQDMTRSVARLLGITIAIVDLGDVWYATDSKGRPRLTGNLAASMVAYP